MDGRGVHICRKCGRTLPVDKFWIEPKTKKPRSRCKDCMRQYSTQWLRNKKAKERGDMNAAKTEVDVESVPSENPKCPKCAAGSNKLKFDGYAQIYECLNFDDCGNRFRVVAGRVLPEGDAPPKPDPVLPPEKVEEKKEETVANEWTCDLCPAVFEVAQALGAHTRFIHGGKKRAAVRETAIEKPKAPKPRKQRPTATADPGSPGDKEWADMTKARATALREEAHVLLLKAGALERRADRLEEVAAEFEKSF
jgi:hypothetical protein